MSSVLVIDFFFPKVSKGLCLILSARKLFELNLFFFFFFLREKGWREVIQLSKSLFKAFARKAPRGRLQEAAV